MIKPKFLLTISAFVLGASSMLGLFSASASAAEYTLRLAPESGNRWFDERANVCLSDSSSRLNLRITPNQKNNPLGKLLHNEQVSVIHGLGYSSLSAELSTDPSTRTGWALVAHEDGRIGWVSTAFLCQPGATRPPANRLSEQQVQVEVPARVPPTQVPPVPYPVPPSQYGQSKNQPENQPTNDLEHVPAYLDDL